MLSTDLQKIAGFKAIVPVLRELEEEGYIETEDVLPRSKVKTKTEDFVSLKSITAGTLDIARESLSPRKKNAATFLAALDHLRTSCDELSTKELARRTRVPVAVVREFIASGLLPMDRREVSRAVDYGTEEKTKTIVLNADQRNAYEAITRAVDSATFTPFLLHGVTGSGKTQVYIEAIRHCLDRGRSAIVLVPEIALTPQIVRRFKTHFGDSVGVVHSRMSAGERHDVWRLARRGDVRVVIGPRSAIFAPLRSLGLIVVDEEHESSYKQYDATPRYHARDVAIVRGTKTGAVVVLGSATPSAESYHNALTGKYGLLRLPTRIDNVPMPVITIVDMTGERKRQYIAQKALLTMRIGVDHSYLFPPPSSKILAREDRRPVDPA